MRIILALALLGLLTACAGPPKPRMFPPSASVQELRVLDDGRWEVALRIQNQARLNIRVAEAALTLYVDGQEAGRIELSVDRAIPSTSAERVPAIISPAARAADAVNLALSEGRSISYRLQGRLRSSEPERRDDPLSFDSRLNPAPGLPGVLR